MNQLGAGLRSGTERPLDRNHNLWAQGLSYLSLKFPTTRRSGETLSGTRWVPARKSSELEFEVQRLLVYSASLGLHRAGPAGNLISMLGVYLDMP
jgi:hypothetical protein